MKKLKIIISGLGIAGASAGIYLQKFGHEVSWVEKKDAAYADGAGITLWGNGIQALLKIINKDELFAFLEPIENIEFKNSKDKFIKSIRLDPYNISEDSISAFIVCRKQLQSLLLSKVPKSQIIWNDTIEEIEKSSSSLAIKLKSKKELNADLIICAEGANSYLRNRYDKSYSLEYCHHACFRSVIDLPKSILPEATSVDYLGKNGYFIAHHMTDGRCYWLGSIGSKKELKYDKNNLKELLLNRFKQWPENLKKLIELSQNEDILVHNIFQTNEVSYSMNNRLYFLGDSAHATAPQLGQGACMALEDSIIFGDLIMSSSNLDELERNLSDYRVKRACNIIKKSRKVAKLYHMNHPLLCKLRDNIIRTIPNDFYMRNFTYAKKIFRD